MWKKSKQVLTPADMIGGLKRPKLTRKHWLRITSLLLFIIISVNSYFLFYYYVVTYIISLITDIPFKRIQKVQIYVIPTLLLFNFLEFIIFSTIQYVPLFSPFSVAAIVAQFTPNLWVLFFFNQIACSTVITIMIHYTFLAQWIDEGRKSLLIKLIAVQIFLAAIVATFSTSPFIEWIERGLS